MEPRNVIAVENETHATCTRTTVDGRSITYSLKVLQQPLRARACGQGAKSSADRRPVDPPPIVELTILQGDKPAAEDVTFTMNANYFLFATLEQARHIAQGRVSQEKSTPPVLTGTPVAGMVYLDRPKPAGYFIFPDLSVRHEGKYRLSFSLYEQLKSSKDQDSSEEAAPSEELHVTHRLDVRSEPFHVFSAKKFPGLTESTSLSRMVAEQGCRVRIRRDVRMRRREPKGGSKEWDEYEDETAAARARQQSATPDPGMYSMVQTPQGGYVEQIPRPRSASNASHQSRGTAFSRRPSLQDISQPYNQSQYPTASHTPQHAYLQQPSYPASHAPPPQQQYQPAPYVQQQASMQPPHPQYPAQSFPPPPAFPPPAQQSGYYSAQSAPPPLPPAPVQAPYASQAIEPAPQPPRASMDYSPQEFRHTSTQHIPPPPPPQGGFSQPTPSSSSSTTFQPQPSLSQHSYSQPPPPPTAPQHTPNASMDLYSNTRPAPLEPLQPPTRANGAHTPTAVKPSFDLPPINTAIMSSSSAKIEASPVTSTAPQSSYFSSTQTPSDTHKRSYGNVFSDRHQSGPLRQGARPGSFNQGTIPSGPLLSAADDDDASLDLDPETLGMNYRRADGRQIRRALPGHT